jgi:CBS domain containing-hemolysin-like protein
MRLALLASISWVMSLTAPLLEFWRFSISWRDLILIAGGLFLLVKATTEIHERLEVQRAAQGPSGAAQAFWPLVAQIVVLDAVFSLDSVITAVGMVNELYVMMAAVVVAVIVMLVASGPLTRFILAHPSLIILCLGFLLMVGLVLVVDGFGIHVPKGYVYSAIGFSILIELINQWGERKRRQRVERLPARAVVADMVLRLLGGGTPQLQPAVALGPDVFAPEERRMVKEVLWFSERPVRSVMTPREKVVWLDARSEPAAIISLLKSHAHHEFPVGSGALDALEGVVRKEDVLARAMDGGTIDLKGLVRHCGRIRETASLLDALKAFKREPMELALVVDGGGKVRGIVTRTDLLEAIAGDLPDLD